MYQRIFCICSLLGVFRQHVIFKSLSHLEFIFVYDAWVCSIDLSVFVPVLYCFDYCSFAIQPETSEPDSFSCVFLSKIALAVWGLLCLHSNFKIFFCSSSMKNDIGNLIEIAMNLQIALGSIGILIILILPIQEHDIAINL